MSKYKGQSSIAGGRFDGTVNGLKVSRYSWQRGVGESVETFLEGSPAYLFGKVSAYKLRYDTIEILPHKDKSGWYVMRLAFAGDDTTDVHDVQGSNLSQSKLLNLKFRKKLIDSGLAVTQDKLTEIVSGISRAVNTYHASGEPTSAGYAVMYNQVLALLDGTSHSTDADTLIKRFMDDLDRNGDSCLQSQYTYVHTICISERVFELNQGSFSDIYLYTDEIFTESEMRDAEGIEASFKLPQQVIDGSKSAFWLKQPTHCRLTSGMKREITLSYLFADEWSDLYY